MLIKKPDFVPAKEITPEPVYLNRRNFIRGAAAIGGTALAAFGFRELVPPARRPPLVLAKAPPKVVAEIKKIQKMMTELGEEPNKLEDIAGYNNYYEFSTDKYDVAQVAKDWKPQTPWTVAVEGETLKPRTLGIEDILQIAPSEERIYRMRCVEGWSMVIPWLGSPLGKLIAALQPTANAKYVEFTTVVDKQGMPGQQEDVLDWPYVEGLRMDEAMHPLTLLATGIYGQPLLNQNGAPLRLVVPWKYGFKGIKSIVKIRFTAEQPTSTWTRANADEYGFYSNVNPHVDHPRWSQAKERRIGEDDKRTTLMFNGYSEVASLYAGMDLKKYF
jgi:sulfoxide reductase catalytic subunit YedY